MLLFLNSLVDLIERRLHRGGDIGFFHLDGNDMDSGFSLVQFGLQKTFGLYRNFIPFADDFINTAVTDHQPHRGFGHIAQYAADVPNLKQKIKGVLNPKLDNPGHDGHV